MAEAWDGERTSGDGSAERGLLDYLRILWRHKLLIALTVIVTTGVAVGLDHVRHRTYQGTAEVLFTVQGGSAATSATGLTSADLATDIELIGSGPVQAAAAKMLNATAPAFTASEVGTTNVAQIVVQSANPDFAAAAANAYARAYIQVATQGYINSQEAAKKQIQTQELGLSTEADTTLDTPGFTTSPTLQTNYNNLIAQVSSSQSEVEQLDQNIESASAGQLIVVAVPDPVPVSPKRVQDAVIAIGIGLLLGIGLALLRENLDDRVRSKDQLEQLIPGIPMLGLIPVIDHWRDRKKPFLVTKTRPSSPPSEAYRVLRTSIQFRALENPTKVLQITSPSAGAGKTTTAANLAWIMADAGQRVVVLDCDLRQPRIHEFFGLTNEVGFTSVLLGEVELEDALRRVPDQPGLLVLPTGPVSPNPSEVLSSAGTQQIFKDLGAHADVIIVDSAPVLPVTDAAVLSTHADAMLLVVSAGMDKGRDVVRSIEMLDQINAPIAGIVLNRDPAPESSAYYRYGREEKAKARARAKAKSEAKANSEAKAKDEAKGQAKGETKGEAKGEAKGKDKGMPKDDKQLVAPTLTNGNGNGNGKRKAKGKGRAADDLSLAQGFPAMEDANVDWWPVGRHAATPSPVSDTPTVSAPSTVDAPVPPQSGDAPHE